MKKLCIGAALLVSLASLMSATRASAQAASPQTAFEASNGSTWTNHQQEIDFLAQIDAASERVSVEQIGTTEQGRPVQLVQVGYPAPRGIEQAQKEPTVMIACSQHGNEPAGREACLKWIRDLAFTTDATLLQQLQDTTFLFVPSANPDGRNANSRGNSTGTDINRDHLSLTQPESQAIAEVVRDWKPDVSLDLHEYGPSTPVLYDDEVLYLWPRNLNVDQTIHDLAFDLAGQKIETCTEAAGYTADEYGQEKVADIHRVRQTAGDEDEGIMRNTMGLRHSLGILVETRVDQDVRNGPDEILGGNAAVQRRRVAAHVTVVGCVLEFVRDNSEAIKAATDQAPINKTEEGTTRSAPVYFSGADNVEPEPGDIQDPAPCAYLLTPEQKAEIQTQLSLHGIETVDAPEGTYVPLGQAAEPVIPLLLDGRARRHAVEAVATDSVPYSTDCGLPPEPEETQPSAALLVAGLIAAAGGLRLRHVA